MYMCNYNKSHYVIIHNSVFRTPNNSHYNNLSKQCDRVVDPTRGWLNNLLSKREFLDIHGGRNTNDL